MPVPRVTITVPTYNRATLLREALQSVMDQTYQDWVIVVADNASTDSTSQVVTAFHDPRIRYYCHSSNIGMTPNWQYAISMAETEFVAPLADDDLYLPEHLATALKALDQYPAAAYYTCPAERFGRSIATRDYRPIAITDTVTPVRYYGPQYAVNFLGTDSPGPMNSMVCRKHVLNGLYWGKPDYAPQDLLVMTQLMVQGGFVFGNRVMTRYRVHETNASLIRQKTLALRFNCMAWHGIRWLAQFLLDKKVCSLEDIEAHGRNAISSEHHVIPLVLGLGSFDSPAQLRAVAKRVFRARTDADQISARFRLARRIGFWVIPASEKISQLRIGWKP